MDPEVLRGRAVHLRETYQISDTYGHYKIRFRAVLSRDKSRVEVPWLREVYIGREVRSRTGLSYSSRVSAPFKVQGSSDTEVELSSTYKVTVDWTRIS